MTILYGITDKMPNCCAECDYFQGLSYPDGECDEPEGYCNITFDKLTHDFYTYRADNCPLIIVVSAELVREDGYSIVIERQGK